MSAVLKEIGPVSNADEEDRIIAEALAILERRHAPGEALTNPAEVRAYLRLRLAERPSRSSVVSTSTPSIG